MRMSFGTFHEGADRYEYPCKCCRCQSLCADALRAVLAEHELIVCPQIVSELRRVLKDKFGVSAGIINDFIWLIQQDAIGSISKHLPDIRLKDHDVLGFWPQR